MDKTTIPIQFTWQGTYYEGWATPSDQEHEDGSPLSYRVVLSQTFFGNLSRDRGKWAIDEQRPHELVMAVGECLEKAPTEEVSPNSQSTF